MATSKEQFRALFETHEPEMLKVLDSFIKEFGTIKNLEISCKTSGGTFNPQSKYGKNQEEKRKAAVRTMVAMGTAK